MGHVGVVVLLALAGCVAIEPPAGGFTATFGDIAGGMFPTALDKDGTAGVNVTVRNVTIEKSTFQDDGDYHVQAHDATRDPFVLEIIPADQRAGLPTPPEGALVWLVGVPYCDRVHSGAAWHGRTCWEIHPLRGWGFEAGG